LLKQCSLCYEIKELAAENKFGFRYLCGNCMTLIYIRYNPCIYTFEEANKKVNEILNKMKKRFHKNKDDDGNETE